MSKKKKKYYFGKARKKNRFHPPYLRRLWFKKFSTVNMTFTESYDRPILEVMKGWADLVVKQVDETKAVNSMINSLIDIKSEAVGEWPNKFKLQLLPFEGAEPGEDDGSRYQIKDIEIMDSSNKHANGKYKPKRDRSVMGKITFVDAESSDIHRTIVRPLSEFYTQAILVPFEN